MNDQSIDFQKIIEDVTSPEIVRKSFRVPINDADRENVWVVIDEKRYTVCNVSPGGISISLKDNSIFTIDQALLNCELNIFNQSVKDLNGKIIQFSSTRKKDWQCGIQWIDLKKETADQILKIVIKMKEQLLKDDQPRNK